MCAYHALTLTFHVSSFLCVWFLLLPFGMVFYLGACGFVFGMPVLLFVVSSIVCCVGRVTLAPPLGCRQIGFVVHKGDELNNRKHRWKPGFMVESLSR